MFDCQRVMGIHVVTQKSVSGSPFLVELVFLGVSENGGFNLNIL